MSTRKNIVRGLITITMVLSSAAAVAEISRRSEYFTALREGKRDLVISALQRDNSCTYIREVQTGLAPLQVTVASSNLNLTNLLIIFGSNPNEADENGDIPLHRAVMQGWTDGVKLLVAAGSNMERKNKAGVSPKQLALRKGAEMQIALSTPRQAVPRLESNEYLSGPYVLRTNRSERYKVGASFGNEVPKPCLPLRANMRHHGTCALLWSTYIDPA